MLATSTANSEPILLNDAAANVASGGEVQSAPACGEASSVQGKLDDNGEAMSEPVTISGEVLAILSSLRRDGKLPSLSGIDLTASMQLSLGFSYDASRIARDAFLVLSWPASASGTSPASASPPAAAGNRNRALPRRIGLQILEVDTRLQGPWLETFSFDETDLALTPAAAPSPTPAEASSVGATAAVPAASPVAASPVAVSPVAASPVGVDATAEAMASAGASKDAALRARLRPVFERFDLDGSGAVSTVEFGSICQAMDMALSAEQLRAMMAEADPDRSGGVDFDEFVTLLQRQLGADGGGAAGGVPLLGLASIFSQATSFFGLFNPLSWFAPAAGEAAEAAPPPPPPPPRPSARRKNEPRSPVRVYGRGRWLRSGSAGGSAGDSPPRTGPYAKFYSPGLRHGLPPTAQAQTPPDFVLSALSPGRKIGGFYQSVHLTPSQKQYEMAWHKWRNPCRPEVADFGHGMRRGYVDQ